MSAYTEGVRLMAHDVLRESTEWDDFTEAVETFAEGWGVSASMVGTDLLTAMAEAYNGALLANLPAEDGQA